MKRVLGVVSTVVLLAVGVSWAGAAVTSSSSFKASYKGKVTEQVNGSAVTAKPSGTGSASLIGKGSLTGTVTGNTSNPPCSPLNGPGTLSGTKGKLKLTLLSGSRACAASADDQNNISFSGSAKVNGGTGKFKKAKGTLRYSGHYDRGTGAFNVSLQGTLKY